MHTPVISVGIPIVRRLSFTMNRQSYLYRNLFVALIFLAYAILFVALHDQVGIGIASLAIFPVICATWYLGSGSGILTAVACVVLNTFVLITHPLSPPYTDPGNLIGSFSLLAIAVITGRFTRLIHERRDAIEKLKQYERERDSHTRFLERLHQITAMALEVDTLQATLEILTEKIADLFSANDAYFNLWDDAQEIPIPKIAFGSMKDIYPYIRFEADDITLTSSVMKMEQPIPVEDLEHSEFISPAVAAIFPNRSMLGIPLITSQRKLGAILLGFNRLRAFDREEITHARVTAEQVALVLSKALLLEDERKQVHQLTALHDVALVAIEADNEDQLIENVVNIIGHNLFPDNFGVMLLDENKEVLHAHPSYRFFSTEKLEMWDIPINKGITGEVARTGIAQRIGNVRRVVEYVDVDERTISELCVPIKFKEQILGVINAESTKRDAFTADDERMLVTLAGQLATALEQLRKAQSERKWLEQLAHSRELTYSIAQISTQIESSLSADEIIQALGKELERIGLTCLMAMYDESQRSFTVNYTSLQPQLLEAIDTALGYPLLKYTFPRDKLEAVVKIDELFRPIAIHDPTEEIKALFIHARKEGISIILKKIGVTGGIVPLRLPLVFEENLLGVLWVWGADITPSDLPIMSIFAKQIGISLERARLFQEVQSLALTDPLTGLQNRRSIFELGRIEFSRADRLDRPFSCMMLDIDHFKAINDTYGHQVGDEVLKEFAKRCLTSVREVDLVGRYGGEELIVLLPETNRDAAYQVAERLRKSIAENRFIVAAEDIQITASIGVAAKDNNTTHLEALIARADQALYMAKHKGRNCVSISV